MCHLRAGKFCIFAKSARVRENLHSAEIETCADAAGQLVVSSRNGNAAERCVPNHLIQQAWLGGRIGELAGGAGMKPIGGARRNAYHTRAYGCGAVVGDRRGWRRKCLQPEFPRGPAPWETGAGQARLHNHRATA